MHPGTLAGCPHGARAPGSPGPSTPLALPRPSASKAGTTDTYRDTWTAGSAPNLAIVVWVGNTDGYPMREVLSSMTAGRI